MSRRGSGRARRIGTGALLIWCLLFLRCETTEQSMIRAVMLERSPQGWTAGLIYQAPEASADSSEAVAEVRFAAAEGGIRFTDERNGYSDVLRQERPLFFSGCELRAGVCVPV